MKKKLGVFCFLGMLALSTLQAQQQFTPSPTNQVLFQAPSPPAPLTLNGSYSGDRGSDTWFYWIVATHPRGQSPLTGPLRIDNAGVLSATNTVSMTWSRASGATSYAVLRTTTNIFPGGNCACAVATGVTITSQVDTGGALGAFTHTGVGRATGIMNLDNEGFPQARMVYGIGNATYSRTTQQGRWSVVGGGTLATRPATCVANRDVYICNGAGCASDGTPHYCTVANTFMPIGGSGSVAAGTANDIPCYVSTGTTLEPCDTGNFTFLTGVVTFPTALTSGATADPADAGALRLGSEEIIAWELATPGVDATFALNSSDRFALSRDLEVAGIRVLSLNATGGTTNFQLRLTEVFIYKDLFFNTDDADDIGQNGTSRRPRTIFVGTSLSIGSGDGSLTLEVEDDTPVTGDTRVQINQGAADSDTTVLLTVAGAVTAKPGGTVPACELYTVAATDLTAAATTEDVVLFNLPARGKLTAVSIKHTVAFSGGTLTAMTVSVGESVTPDTTFYSSAFNIFQAIGDTIYLDTDMFKSPTYAASDVLARFTATGDNMNNVGTGSVGIVACWVVLP